METWSKGKTFGTVITDSPLGLPENSGHSGTDANKYYGGALVCESIWRKKDVALISSAPDLFEVSKEVLQLFRKQGYTHFSQVGKLCAKLEKAIQKSENID